MRVTHPDSFKRKRIMLLLFLVILAIVGLGMKFYQGSGRHFISDKLAGFVYVVFWTFAAAAVWIRRPPTKLGIIVVLITCALEFTQLYDNILLNSVRSTFVGHALIGSSFNWSDIIFYIMGGVAAIFWLKKFNRNFMIS